MSGRRASWSTSRPPWHSGHQRLVMSWSWRQPAGVGSVPSPSPGSRPLPSVPAARHACLGLSCSRLPLAPGPRPPAPSPQPPAPSSPAPACPWPPPAPGPCQPLVPGPRPPAPACSAPTALPPHLPACGSWWRSSVTCQDDTNQGQWAEGRGVERLRGACRQGRDVNQEAAPHGPYAHSGGTARAEGSLGAVSRLRAPPCHPTSPCTAGRQPSPVPPHPRWTGAVAGPTKVKRKQGEEPLLS